jgi:protease-4
VYLQEFIDDYYTRFIQIVSKSRKEDIATIKEIADGKIYWAPKAKELGLIDEIGDINTAINYASKIGKCSKDIVLFKPKVSFLRKFVGNAASSFYDELSNKLLAERINLN